MTKTQFDPKLLCQEDEEAFLAWYRWGSADFIVFRLLHKKVTECYKAAEDKKLFISHIRRQLQQTTFLIGQSTLSAENQYNILQGQAYAKFLERYDT